MKKYLKRAVIYMIAAVFVCLGTTPFAAAKDNGGNSSQSTNKYNVVFVIDESGSMGHTDPDLYRNDAIKLFLSLMSKQGNKVGTVMFNDGVVDQYPLTAIDGMDDKKAVLSNIVNKTKPDGDTDIGHALEAAAKMLDEGRDKKLPSAIILLTDGKLDLDSNKAVEESREALADAIESAREPSKDYRVYSVCLNVDGSAAEGVRETRQISDATNGESVPVTAAEDLMDVYRMFYGVLYDDQIPDPTSIKGGEFSFDVPNAGVEEANVMIYGKIKSCVITDPSGKSYNAEETPIRNVTLEKIYSPAPGKWKVKVSGDPNAKMQYNLIFNYDFKISDVTKVKSSYSEGDTIAIQGELALEDGSPISKEDQGDFAVKTVFIDSNEKVIDEKTMAAKGGKFVYEYKIPDKRSVSYYISAKYAAGDKYGNVEKKTKPRQIVVSNSAPTPVEDPVVVKKKIIPFRDKTIEIDLTKLATDKEDGGKLDYQIHSTSFVDKAKDPDKGDYIVNGNTIVQDHYSLSKGSYVVRCTDSGGLYCDVTVTVKSYNIGLMALIGLGAAALIALIIILILFWMAMNAPSGGCVSVRTDNGREPIQADYWRGRCKLALFDLPPSNLNYSKCYFQAVRKKPYTVLVTDKPVYVGGRATKEVKIQNSPNETAIALDQETRTLMYVKFFSEFAGIRGGVRRRRGGIGGLLDSITGIFGGRRQPKRGPAGAPRGGRKSKTVNRRRSTGPNRR